MIWVSSVFIVYKPMLKKTSQAVALLLCFSLIFDQVGFAQLAPSSSIAAGLGGLARIPVPDRFRPIHLRFLSYNDTAGNFQLLLDRGDLKDPGSEFLSSSTKFLMDYFFIGLALPNEAFWVNLSPDAPERILDEQLATTDLGRVLLEADVQLKRDTARATSPETPEGRQYWTKLYAKADELFSQAEDIDIPAVVRPWIVPGEILIREAGSSAYIYKATLKVMLEEDYIKSAGRDGLNRPSQFADPRLKALNEYSSKLLNELIIPTLTRQVNASKRYAPLRQVYYSLILAQWFKSRFQGAGTVPSRIDSRDLTGLTSQKPWDKKAYFKQYLKSFKGGEYHLQDTVATSFGETTRTYVSGGIRMMALGPGSSSAVTIVAGTREKIGIHAPGISMVGYDPALSTAETVASSAAQPAIATAADARAGLFDTMRQWFNRVTGRDRPTPEAQAQARLAAVAETFRTRLGFDFDVVVVQPGTGEEFSMAWVDMTSAKPKVHILQDFLMTLTDAEIAFVLGHELGHPAHKDKLFHQVLVQMGGLPRFKRYYAFIDAHREIEADKQALEYMDKLGIPRQAGVTALQKAIAFGRQEHRYRILARSEDLRIAVLRDRMNNPDTLADFYVPFEAAGIALALGFRYEMRDDLENAHQRAEDLFMLAELILGIADLLHGQPAMQDTLEAAFAHFEQQLKAFGWQDDNRDTHHPFNRRVLLEVGVTLAALGHLQQLLEENRNSMDATNYLYYRDMLRFYRQDRFEVILRQMLDPLQKTDTVRFRTRKTASPKEYYPGKLLEDDPMEFPYEMFEKLLVLFGHLIPLVPKSTATTGNGNNRDSTGDRQGPSRDSDRSRWRLRGLLIPIPLVLLTLFFPTPTSKEKTPITKTTIIPRGNRGGIAVHAPFEESETGVTKSGKAYTADGSAYAVFIDKGGNTRVQDGGWVAADLRVFPIGTKLTVHFRDGSVVTYQVLDTGGKVKGRMIDLSTGDVTPGPIKKIYNTFEGAIIEGDNGVIFKVTADKGAGPSQKIEIVGWQESESGEGRSGGFDWTLGLKIIPIIWIQRKSRSDDQSGHPSRGSSSPAQDHRESPAVRTPVPTEQEAPGGIDFRALPISIQPAFSPSVVAVSIKSDEAFAKINAFLQQGQAPERSIVADYLAACTTDADDEGIDEMFSAIAGLLRDQEEYCQPTEPALRELVSILG